MSIHSRSDFPVKAHARIAGLFYLAVIGLGVVTLMLRANLLVRGNGAATAANIAAHALEFRLSLLAEVAASLAYLTVVVLLFKVMAPAGRQLSALAAAFGFAGCTAGAIAVVPLALPLIEAAGAQGGPPNAEMALLAVGLYSFAYKIALVFFGCYCLLLGTLTIRAPFLPTVLGLLLIVSGLSWLTTGVATFVSPAAARAVGTLALAGGGLGESLFTIWLICFGVDQRRWQP
ncbi:MAG: DUF4386 domain-containing protein [Sphingomonas sp.]